jgi:hypothetical protein
VSKHAQRRGIEVYGLSSQGLVFGADKKLRRILEEK